MPRISADQVSENPLNLRQFASRKEPFEPLHRRAHVMTPAHGSRYTRI